MKANLGFLVVLMVLLSAQHLSASPGKADKNNFDEIIYPFMDQYCFNCHNDSKQKGEVNLEGISHDLASGKDIELWQAVLKQLVLEEMPPPKKDQPGESEKNEVMFWINSELKKSGNSGSIYAKLESPSYGNYVNHEKLFSGEIKAKPYSPSRLWRTSPNIFENIKSSYGGEQRHLKQPFIVQDKAGIKEYANLLFADSAVVNVLIKNAGHSAERLIEKDRQFKGLVKSEGEPDLAKIKKVLINHFKRVVYREPEEQEIENYIKLYSKSAKEGGNFEAMRVTLMAIMLHFESVYRIEIGLGKRELDGRRLLSPAEMAFSISYGLTDRRPDEILMKAAHVGKLNSREDAKTQVERILKDDRIEKPRILRFFQEFFDYTHAHKVFKDEKRSGGFAYYGENYPNMYERDADFFVMNILEKDQDVFKELLTSNEYFILNRQTFRNTVYDFYMKNKEQIDQGNYSEAMNQELLELLDLKDWKELNKKYFLHKFNRGFKGSVKAILQIVKEVRKWKNSNDDKVLRQGMQPLYKKYPMVYNLRDDEQNFLLPQPYKRPNRAGILTHPAWLIAHSFNDHTDPIRRGKWVRERLLAGVVPDLPITVDASIPEDHHKTLRERLKVTEQQECWRCHELMNPLGYTFENFDDFGRYRINENLDKLKKENGKYPTKPVDAKGEIKGSGEKGVDGVVDDSLDMIHKLADSNKVRQSIIRHAFRYFMGRNEMLSDSKTLIEADKAYLESGGSFNALLISLLTSDSFLYRKNEESKKGT